MKKSKTSWKLIVIVAVLSASFALGIAVKLDWVSPTRAEKDSPQWIFGGSTPGSFADLAERVQAAVVNISTTKTIDIRRGPFYQFHGDYFQRNFPGGSGGIKRPNSLGSGFILDKDGYILTNNHVIEGADEILVKLSDGRTFQAKSVGRDPQSDIAVIKIDTKESLPTVQLGDSDSLKIGDWVVAIGNPFGLTQTVTAGILSAKGRVIGAGPYDNFLQTDASINPGNSGGPLFNLKGEVVGVNTAIIAGGQGIGFAIPINMAKNIIPQLIKGQKVERGYLGIGLKEVTPELAKSLGFDRPKGVLVALVYAGSPADQAGIAAGDLILSFNGHAIEQGQDLPILVSQSPVGSASEVEIWRDGETKTVKVHMGSSLEGGGQQPAASSPTRGTTQGVLGVAVRDLSSQESRQLGLESGVGVAVTGVQRGSPAAGVGLQAGDVILEINDNNITNSKDFFNSTQGLRSGQVVRIFVRRGPLASYFAFSL